MSDQSQGPGWWLAADGKWYPPERHPDHVPLPSPPVAIALCGLCGTPLAAPTAVVCLACGAHKEQAKHGNKWFKKGTNDDISTSTFWIGVLLILAIGLSLFIVGKNAFDDSVDDSKDRMRPCYDTYEIGSQGFVDCIND